MSDKIFVIGNKKEEVVLRKKIPPLDLARENKKELKDLIKRMRVIMKKANGIGLSANQIGFQKRLFVAQVPDEHGHQKFYAVINPEIVKVSKEKISSEEGCLSVPIDLFGLVERPEQVVLQGYNLEGKKIKIKAWGLLARVFQHEVDHLNGTIFVDKTKHLNKKI